MENNVILTTDGSNTLFSNQSGECYHSTNGAITESKHIFINLGLNALKTKKISILEIGYGTGLNAIMTYKSVCESDFEIFYHGIDVVPLNERIGLDLKYEKLLNENKDVFSKFYGNWNQELEISKNFILFKQEVSIDTFDSNRKYDLVYFDAFSPESQPEMWTCEVFDKIYKMMKSNAILVTYSSKGIVKQNLRTVGFDVRRLPGPPGKRHVIRATKL